MNLLELPLFIAIVATTYISMVVVDVFTQKRLSRLPGQEFKLIEAIFSSIKASLKVILSVAFIMGLSIAIFISVYFVVNYFIK